MAWLWDIAKSGVVNTDHVSGITARPCEGGREVVAVETMHANCADKVIVLAVCATEEAARDAVRAACRVKAAPADVPFTVPSDRELRAAWLERHANPEPF